MICVDCLQISLNRLLLLAIGLWPYQQSVLVRLQFFLLFGILMTFILFQFTALLTSKCTPDLLIEVLSSALFCVFLAIKYFSFNINTEDIKCLLEQLQHMYDELIDKNEIDIIKRHASFAKRYTIGLLLTAIFFTFSLILYLFWPYILNLLFATNVTQSRSMIITEYFIDQEKYYYLILFHAIAAVAIDGTALLATGAMFITYLKYVCGMFQIARTNDSLRCHTHAHDREEMICTNSLHIGLNKCLLLIVGLWPYQQSKLIQLQLTLFISVLMTFIWVQFTVFFTSECTSQLLINVLGSALFYVTLAIKYSSFSVKLEVVKYMLDQLQHMYNELTDENEINIIKQYAIYAKRYTIIFTLLVALMILIFILHSTWLSICDIVLPINETRTHLSSLATEYFVDHERYFYLIFFHTNAAFIIGLLTMLATGTMFIVYLHYACGMFQITCYRIAEAITHETLQKNNLQNENLIYKELICAVDMHRRALKFSDLIISKFKLMFSLLILVGVICGTFNVFRVFQLTSSEYDIEELSLRLIFLIVHFSYMFVGNYLAQEIIDRNNDVFVTAYNVQWYIAPLQIQKIILFLLQRGNKEYTINIAGLFVASLEGAASLISTGLSILTVLYSTRRKRECRIRELNEAERREKSGKARAKFKIKSFEPEDLIKRMCKTLSSLRKSKGIIKKKKDASGRRKLAVKRKDETRGGKLLSVANIFVASLECFATCYARDHEIFEDFTLILVFDSQIAKIDTRQEKVACCYRVGIYLVMLVTIYIITFSYICRLCKYFTCNFDGTFFILVIIDVVILSLNHYRIFQCLSDGSDKQELILHVEIVIISLLYMFLANYVAQEITDHNNHVFITVYNGHWYIAPLHIQKIILFLLQVGNKTFGLSCGGLFTGSLYTFATLVNTSMSYFTVLYLTQKL
ncbi:uncharacterized protein LOC105198335 [Solenopsis invicta]|uniref:uncharacterized protein LOC105198335 n=1 Tax=Solenopsis invicta TaxID=13686 RepID=UPI00193D544A|nr:uncharacterized protein LOC105198335 [Solenopsis invicta]